MADREDDERLQLAGMALRNGVLVLGPTSWGVALRDDDGSIHAASGRRPAFGDSFIRRIPLLRGPVALANMLLVLPTIRRAEPRIRFGFESRGVLAVLLGGMILSTRLRRAGGSAMAGELLSGGVSLAATLATMRTGEVAAYHGAEHKAIGAYEQSIDAADTPRQHPRCGTQLALPMLGFSALATQLALAAMPDQPRTARTLGQFLGIAAATELFRAAQRGLDTPLSRGAARAGIALQTHATTREPSRAQLDVAEAALATLLEREAAAGAV